MSDIVDELRLIGCHENGEARCTCGIGMDAADEIARLRDENAALTRERDALHGALQDTLANGSFYKETDVDWLMDERDAARRERDALMDALEVWRAAYKTGRNEPLVIAYESTAAMKGASND